jgi:hypothetical protein
MLEFFSKLVADTKKKHYMRYKCEQTVTKRILKHLIDIIILNLRIWLNESIVIVSFLRRHYSTIIH